MTFTKLNSLGVQVMPVSEFFYTEIDAESFSCCGDYQMVHYCFKSNTQQGCGFCEFDYTSPCECEACEG